MSALAEEGLREINELSSLSGDSLKTSIEELESGRSELQEKSRAMVMETEARMLALYQLAALKAKKADDFTQVGKIWHAPLLVYETGFKMISALVSKGDNDPYVAHLLETVSKLRDQVRWVYELHTDQ